MYLHKWIQNRRWTTYKTDDCKKYFRGIFSLIDKLKEKTTEKKSLWIKNGKELETPVI